MISSIDKWEWSTDKQQQQKNAISSGSQMNEKSKQYAKRIRYDVKY